MEKIYLFIGLVVLLVGGWLIVALKPKNIGSNFMPVRIGYNTESIANASIIVAYEKGYFQKHGISPQMVPLKSGREVMQALAADQVDLGIGSITNFMQAMAKGAPIRIIAASASSPSFIFIRPNENLSKFTDLYGKNVLVNASGINDLFFRLAMNEENIDLNKMQFADIERAYQVIALMEKKAVDAVIVSEQDAEVLIKAGAVILPEWETKGYAKRFLPRNSVVINTGFLNRQETAVENFLNAIADAHRLINGHPTEAADILSKHIKDGSGGAVIRLPEEIAGQWKNKEVINMIWQDPAITMELVKKARELGIIDKELALQDVYDLRFENKLTAAQKEIYGETN